MNPQPRTVSIEQRERARQMMIEKNERNLKHYLMEL
jgi:hypothetical protein